MLFDTLEKTETTLNTNLAHWCYQFPWRWPEVARQLKQVCWTRMIYPMGLVSQCVPHLMHLLCLVEVVRLVGVGVGDMICLLHTANPLGVVHLVHFVTGKEQMKEQMKEQRPFEVHSLVVVVVVVVF